MLKIWNIFIIIKEVFKEKKSNMYILNWLNIFVVKLKKFGLKIYW